MDLIIYMAVFMLLVGAFFLGLFLLALKTGQFRDLKTPAHKILLEDEKPQEENKP